MVKSLYNVALGFALICAVSSCGNDWLNTYPSNGMDSETAITKSGDLEAAHTGMYAALKGNSTYVDYYGRSMNVYGEMHGEDLQYNEITGSNRASFFYFMNYNSASQFGDDVPWLSAYVVIGAANRIIEASNPDVLSDYEDTKGMVEQYKNEALVLRAMALFDLTKVYGKPYTEDQGTSLGVPITTTSLSDTAKLARNTVAECYTQVLADLDAAISSNALSEEPSLDYVNQWEAKALLVRVYMTMGNFSDALATAKDIIDNSPYTLWTRDEYLNAWDKNSSAHGNEIIFQLGITNNGVDWQDREGYAYLFPEAGGEFFSGYGDMIASKKFTEMLTSDPSDIRNDIFLASYDDPNDEASTADMNAYGSAKVFLNKYRVQSIDDPRYQPIPMMRLSEVYLSAAEAAMNLGNTADAVTYLNAIIQNRTTDAAQLVDESTIDLNRIYIERRKELVGEGQRYFDALRRNETITRFTSDNDRGWNSSALTKEAMSYNRTWFKAIAAIPSAEINANPNLKQNPGYAQ